VLGMGAVCPVRAILVAGEPGIGKSTGVVVRGGGGGGGGGGGCCCRWRPGCGAALWLYASGEESLPQIKGEPKRPGAWLAPNLMAIATSTCVEMFLEAPPMPLRQTLLVSGFRC